MPHTAQEIAIRRMSQLMLAVQATIRSKYWMPPLTLWEKMEILFNYLITQGLLTFLPSHWIRGGQQEHMHIYDWFY